MIGVSIFDEGDGVTYTLSFSDEDANTAAINWGDQTVALPSIGGSISIKNGWATIMYGNGSGQAGSISCRHQDLIDQLNDPNRKFDEAE